MRLNPDGVLAFGLKIGRRSADLMLVDFTGAVRGQISTTYPYALPSEVFGFLRDGLATLLAQCPATLHGRICGIGIATPFELWKWNDKVGLDAKRFSAWKDVDFADEVSKVSDLPVFVVNDATAACHAEHLYGETKDFWDYAYVFIGSFIGGGVVVNGSVFEGNRGNAGALGSLRTTGPMGESRQLIDVASIHLLEARLVEVGVNPDTLWRQPQDWSALARYVEPWIGETAQELAKASLSICSVIDFEAIIIDGAFPADIRFKLVERTRRYLEHQDLRGLMAPQIRAGSIGENARGIGAASTPIFTQFLLNTNSGLSGF